MKCTICKHGVTSSGKVSVSLERDGAIVVIKKVPADVCENCGEYYLSEEVSWKVMGMAEDAAARKAEIEVLAYAA